MIEFRCPHCSHSIKTSDEHAGKKAKCAACGKPIVVPEFASVPSAPLDAFEDGAGEPGPSLDVHRSAAARNLEGCPDCAELISLRALTCPRCGCPVRKPLKAAIPPVPRRYTALRFFAALYFITGVLLLTGAAVFLAIAAERGSLAAAGPVCAGLIGGAITSFAMAQVISVFLDLEEHSRAIRKAVEDR